MMEYTEYEDAIAAMIGNSAKPLPDANIDFTQAPATTKSFVVYSSSTFDNPEINFSNEQLETMMFDIFIFGLKRRKDILPYLTQIQRKVIGKRIGSYCIEAVQIQGYRQEEKYPSDTCLTVKIKRPSIWDDSDLPDADDAATDGDDSEIYNLKNPEFKN